MYGFLWLSTMLCVVLAVALRVYVWMFVFVFCSTIVRIERIFSSSAWLSTFFFKSLGANTRTLTHILLIRIDTMNALSWHSFNTQPNAHSGNTFTFYSSHICTYNCRRVYLCLGIFRLIIGQFNRFIQVNHRWRYLFKEFILCSNKLNNFSARFFFHSFFFKKNKLEKNGGNWI